MYGMQGISGIILGGRQYMNSLAESSLEEIKGAIREEPFLDAYYEIGDTFIRSKDRRITYAFAGLDRNIGSVKSKGRILLAWVDEAEPVTESSWAILVPTLREEGSGWNAELWVTWNPERKKAAVEERYRDSSDPLVKVVELNWRDNPKFPAKLERERLRDMKDRPDQYMHIWEGEHRTVATGAYYAEGLAKAKSGGRIGRVSADPLMTIRAWWDIGGTGAKADACAIWIGQFIGHEIRVLDYYEAVGQPLAVHLQWLRDKGYERAHCVLPHDGAAHEKVYAVSYEGAVRAAGFDVRVIPNMGAGAATRRIEAARRLFPSIWFNESTTEGGRDALGWYHEKQDDKRQIGLGPCHDWSSHGADAFGLMAVDHADWSPAAAVTFSESDFESEYA
jgi:phage terminase large subunit